MNKYFRYSVAAIAAMNSLGFAKAEEMPSYYNAGEAQGSFDLAMKPYPIPVQTTTYVDFFFNLPDELPDLFHVVMGEVINSQPEHLHHFVLTGCSSKIDADKEGLPVEFERDDIPECVIPLGGWAPGGNVFGNIDNEVGVLMGKGLGVQAIQMNVHYTDGVYEDPEAMTQRIANDGIRVHYTPDFRPYTSTSKPLINIGFATKQLVVPAGEERFYVTKTCKVNTNCQDASPELIRIVVETFGMGDSPTVPDDLSCPGIKLFCNMGGDIGSFIQQLCPESCGYCDAVEGEVNPMDPGRYRMTGINYHAHLLGREMYTTLLREENENLISVQKSAPNSPINPTTTSVTDLKSSEFWIYDFQETIPLDYNDYVSADGTNEIMRGTEIRPGDRIQATCVYDSTNREKDTIFSLATYDEMCITTATVTFDTPPALLNGNATSDTGMNILTEINLMSFSCDADEETDVYTGTLAPGEDARDIWKNHPISEAEGCTFPATDFTLALYETRNCPINPDIASDSPICDGLGETMKLISDNNAGATCYEGVYAERDANDGLTEAECLEGGGSWEPYTCGEMENWFMYEATFSGLDTETLEYLRVEWWQKPCCGHADHHDTKFSGDISALDSAASIAGSSASLVALASASVLAMIL